MTLPAGSANYPMKRMGRSAAAGEFVVESWLALASLRRQDTPALFFHEQRQRRGESVQIVFLSHRADFTVAVESGQPQ